MEDASRRMWTGGSATKACDLRGNDLRPTLGRVGKLRDTGRGRAVGETRKKRSDQVDGSKGGRTRQLVTWTRTVQYRDEHPSSSRVLHEIWPPPHTHTHISGFFFVTCKVSKLWKSKRSWLSPGHLGGSSQSCIFQRCQEKNQSFVTRTAKEQTKVQTEISSTPVTKQCQGFLFVCLFLIPLKIKLYFRL